MLAFNGRYECCAELRAGLRATLSEFVRLLHFLRSCTWYLLRNSIMHVITLFQAFLLFSRMHPSLISPQLQLKINELFFPKSETLDIGPSSNSPFAKELAQLFVHGAACDKQCLSKADVLEGFVTMATGYARRTSSIQTVGNSYFRLALFQFFQPASMKPSFKDEEIMSQRINVALELKLHEEDISDLSPVGASDDENPPLLRSQTTTPITMMESLGQHLLIWDHETRQLFDVIVAELFGCPAPGAAAVSKRDLEALVHAAGDGSDQVDKFSKHMRLCGYCIRTIA